MRMVPTYMYVFEVTKPCGYGAFIMVYKDAPLADIHRFVSYEMSISPSRRLYFMNPETREEYDIPNTGIFTVRELITKFQRNDAERNDAERNDGERNDAERNDAERNDAPTFQLRPIYGNVDSLVVYRLYYDDGIIHDHHVCC